jgi:hypothetical protein
MKQCFPEEIGIRHPGLGAFELRQIGLVKQDFFRRYEVSSYPAFPSLRRLPKGIVVLIPKDEQPVPGNVALQQARKTSRVFSSP